MQAGPKSERISPNKFDATTTSNHSGLRTNHIFPDKTSRFAPLWPDFTSIMSYRNTR